MMKSIFLLSSALTLSLVASAQTEVTVGVMPGTDYGVTYMLPKTEIEIKVHATKHTYTPGEFCRYADRYLRLAGVSDDPDIYWTLDQIETALVGVPDKEHVYFVKMKDKTVAPLMELTEDGIVHSINLPFSGKKAQEAPQATKPEKEVDPRSFLTEEILMSSSTAKMAELVAKEIYSIRESKNALIRGEADNMPTDGNQLKLMLENLNIQEKALTEMFTGKEKKDTQILTIRIVPEEKENAVALRFSSKQGVVDKDDLSGEPVYISIRNKKVLNLAPTDDKKKLEGIIYNVPGQAQIVMTYKNKEIFNNELPVTQFGTQEYLAPVLFNKKSSTTVLFDTTTGGLLKVDRESEN